MRIAYLSSFYPLRGGIAQFNASLFRAFEKNHLIKAFNFTTQYPSLFFPGKNQYVADDEVADKIPAQPVLNSINPVSYLYTAKEIKKFSPDILLMKYWMPFLAPSLGTVAGMQSNKTKSIAILDNVIPHENRWFDDYCNNYFLKKIHGAICMSKTVQRQLHTSPLPQIPSTHIKHPVYNHFGDRLNREVSCGKLGIDPDKKNLLFFGFIRPYKGLDLLLKSLHYLGDQYQLIIAGESYEKFDRYQHLIQECTHSSRIHVHERYIPNNEVALFFSAADACILPYKSATQSGIGAIAAHYKLPIIATPVGGLAESGPQYNISFASEVSPRSLADAIRNHFNTDTDRLSFNQTQSDDVDWDFFRDQILSFYKQL